MLKYAVIYRDTGYEDFLLALFAFRGDAEVFIDVQHRPDLYVIEER